MLLYKLKKKQTIAGRRHNCGCCALRIRIALFFILSKRLLSIVRCAFTHGSTRKPIPLPYNILLPLISIRVIAENSC